MTSQLKDLSSAINKCSTIAQKFTPNICTIVKTSHKFSKESFVTVANDLTDVSYLFEDVDAFYSSFQNCLNEQKVNQTARTSVRNIDNLIYQLDVYVLTGLDKKLASSGEDFGMCFGQQTQDVVTLISVNLIKEFNIVRGCLSTLRDNFQAIDDSDSEFISDADIDTTALIDLVTAFKDIAVTQQQIDTLMTGLVASTTTLNTVITSVQNTQMVQVQRITKASYELDISV